MSFGTDPFTPTTTLSTTTSRTKTSYVSNDSFQMPSFTTKTGELHPCESIARCSTSSASLPPSPTLWCFANWRKAQVTLSRRPSPKSTSNLASHTHGPLALDVIYRTPMSCQSERSSSELDDPSLASLPHLFDPCWTASPNWSTTYCPKRFPTTWQKEMSSTSSSSSRTPTLTRSLLRAYTTKTSPVFSQALTLTASSPAGDWPCNSSRPSWAPTPTKSSQWRQLLAIPPAM